MSEAWFFVNVDVLGLAETSKILSIGVLAINDENRDSNYHDIIKTGININISMKGQEDRTADDDTLKFWNERIDFNEFKKTKLSIHDAYESINSYLIRNNFDKSYARIFSRGFRDAIWWGHFCKYTLKKPDIMPFYAWRDVKTVLDIFTGIPKVTRTDNANYTSLNDCVDDYISIREGMSKF